MREVRTLCDRCHEPGASGVGLVVDRKADAAGGMEDVELSADLCISCKAAIFELLLRTDTAKDILVKVLSRLTKARPESAIGKPVFKRG